MSDSATFVAAPPTDNVSRSSAYAAVAPDFPSGLSSLAMSSLSRWAVQLPWINSETADRSRMRLTREMNSTRLKAFASRKVNGLVR